VDLAIGKGLKVKSTMFPHKNIHKGTWVSPDGRHVHQIDHILINERFANNIADLRTYRGTDCDSDHFLIARNLRVKLKTMSRNMRPEIVRYDVEKLRDSSKVKEFQENIQKTAQEFNSNPETVDEQWKIIKHTLGNVSEKVLGKAHRTKKPWFNVLCQEALKRRKIARERWLNDASNQERIFRVKRKEAHNIFRCETRKYVQNVIREAEQNYRSHNTWQLYHKVNSFKGGYRRQEKFLKKDDGSLVTNQEKIMEKWAEYFEKLLNCEVPVDTLTFGHNEPNDDPCPPPSKEEIEQQINRLKNHKSPGEDDLQGEILKYADSSMIKSIYLLIKEVWETEILPTDWGVAYICPIHKKGDKQVCSNYRGIALLDTTYKVL